MGNDKRRYANLVKKNRAIQDLISYLKDKLRVEETIPSEKDLEHDLGYPHQQIREALIVLESFGYLDIQHGKATTLIRSLSNETMECSEAALKRKLNTDEKLIKIVELISRSCQVNTKLPGERQLAKHSDIKRDKLREVLLRLECAGFIDNKQGCNRKIIKELSCLML